MALAIIGIILFVPIRSFNLDVSNYYLAGFIFVEVSLFFIERVEEDRKRARLAIDWITPSFQIIISGNPPIKVSLIALVVGNHSDLTVKDCEVGFIMLERLWAKNRAFWVGEPSMHTVRPKSFITDPSDPNELFNALVESGFLVKTTDIDPGDSRTVVVALGFDSIPKKFFIATDPIGKTQPIPKDVPLPKDLTLYAILRIRINAENFRGLDVGSFGVRDVGSWNTFRVEHLGRLLRVRRIKTKIVPEPERSKRS